MSAKKENVKKSGKVLVKHAISVYLSGISQLLKIRDVKKLQRGINIDLIIKHQMVSLGCRLVCTFSTYLLSF